jgi:glycosyltransferase involved in cell wall biosynthesis
MKTKRVVVAIYIDPDFYPPTINAILNLAEKFEEVIVVSRNNCLKDFPYPPNVRLKKIGTYCTVREMEKQSAFQKTKYFLQFSFALLRQARNKNIALIVLYDSFALFGFYLLRIMLGKKKTWYHNHDMPNRDLNNKYSIGGFAALYEKKAMKHIDFFSLPSQERLQYYTGIEKKISTFIIPNYPSLKVYKCVQQKKDNLKMIQIIFQGFIGEGHSLENLVELLQEKTGDHTVTLLLKGSVRDQYKSSLNTLAKKFDITNKITWIPVGPYSELPAITASGDIGIGINMNTDIISLAQGTASNKIYEYAASGLPVILYDSHQFRKYLDKYKWAFFTDGSLQSLKKIICIISENLPELKSAARKSFEEELNFEKKFQPVLQQVITFLD